MTKYEPADTNYPECASSGTHVDITRDPFYCADCKFSEPIEKGED